MTLNVLFERLTNLPAKRPLALVRELAHRPINVRWNQDAGPDKTGRLVARAIAVLAVRHQFAYPNTNL